MKVLILEKMSDNFIDEHWNADNAAEIFAREIFENWEIGNDGVLLFISVKDDGRVKIIAGQGTRIKLNLSDDEINKICKDVRPLLKNQRIPKAMRKALLMISAGKSRIPPKNTYPYVDWVLNNIYKVSEKLWLPQKKRAEISKSVKWYLNNPYGFSFIAFIFIFLFFLVFIWTAENRKRRQFITNEEILLEAVFGDFYKKLRQNLEKNEKKL